MEDARILTNSTTPRTDPQATVCNRKESALLGIWLVGHPLLKCIMRFHQPRYALIWGALGVPMHGPQREVVSPMGEQGVQWYALSQDRAQRLQRLFSPLIGMTSTNSMRVTSCMSITIRTNS